MNVKRYLTLVKEDCALIFLERFCVSVRRDSFCLRMDSHVKISMNVVTAAVCAVMVSVRTTWEDTSVGVWTGMAPTLSTHHV